MRIYMDVCCLSRLFDDLTNYNVLKEAIAIEKILDCCKAGDWILVGSSIIDYEISMTQDEDKKQKISDLSLIARDYVEVDETLKNRALEIGKLKFKIMDSSHISCAEKAKVDVFLTTDEKLLKKALKYKHIIKTDVANPHEWFSKIEKGTKDETTNNDNE